MCGLNHIAFTSLFLAADQRSYGRADGILSFFLALAFIAGIYSMNF
jgi:phosphate starvation-inducible membrane PsiE